MKIIHNSKLFLKRNTPTILTSLGGVGVIATAVLAAKATPKALVLIEQAKEEKGEELTQFEKVKTASPVYIPSIITGTATIACIFGANTLNKRKQASLMSAYALLDRSYKDYKNKVEELYGKEADAEIKKEIAKDKYEVIDISVNDEKQLFYDELSMRYFESTMIDVIKAEYQINKEFINECQVGVNRFYDLLDIPRKKSTEDLGWSIEAGINRYGYSWIDFEHEKVVMDDGLECYIISMKFKPHTDYLFRL